MKMNVPLDLLRMYRNMLIVFILISAQWSTGRKAKTRSLADDENLSSPHLVADKADLFLAYAAVPGYK